MRVRLIHDHDHRKEVTGFDPPNPRHHWWFLNGETDWRRDALGRRNPRACRRWLVLRCGYSDKCPAHAVVSGGGLEDMVAKQLGVRNEAGKVRP